MEIEGTPPSTETSNQAVNKPSEDDISPTCQTLLDAVDEQQTWIEIFCKRFNGLRNELSGKKHQEKIELSEFLNLEATVNMMNNLTSELMTKLKKTEKEAEDTRLSLERALETLQEDIQMMQEDRIASEMELRRQTTTLIEEIDFQKESVIAGLREECAQRLQENTQLKMELDLERKAHRETQAANVQVPATTYGDTDLLTAVLYALWQGTSDANQLIVVLSGAPRLIEILHTKLVALLPKRVPASLLASSATSASLLSPEISLLLPLCGLLVNLSSAPEGRRIMLQTSVGQVLPTVLEWIRTFCAESSGNQQNLSVASTFFSQLQGEHKFSTGGFNRNQTSFNTPPMDDKTNLDKTKAKELLLLIVSNSISDKEAAVAMIECDLYPTLTSLIAHHETLEPLKRYAVRIAKAALEFVPWIGQARIAQQTALAAKQTSSKTTITLGECYKQVGDLITLLSKDPTMKMAGLDLLSALQRIMPMED